jgi:predicted ester cyclase
MSIPSVVSDYIAGLKAHDVDRIAATVADDVAFVTPSRTLTKEQFLAMLRALYGAFPDWHYEHEEPQQHDDTIVVVWRQSGTHTAALALPGLAPIPATGRRVKIPPQRFVYKVRGDRIVEIRPEAIPGGAPRGILEQLGVAAPPL